MNRNKIFLLLLLLPAILCVAASIYEFNKYNEYYYKSKQTLKNISNQLGVEPDWDSVRFEVYCHILDDNVTLDEIEKRLTGITTFEIGRDDEEHLHFTIYFTEPYAQLDDVGLTFNDQYQLVGKFLRVGLAGSDIAPIDCSEQGK